MPKIGHIAIRSRDCRKAADFFKNAFGFTEIGRPAPAGAKPPPAVGLTDGTINLTFLTVPPDNVGCEEDFFGIQHIGIVIDGIETWTRKLEGLGAPCILGEDRIAPGGHYEIKFRGPDDVVFDISPSPWPGTPGTHRTGRVQSGDVKLFFRHFRGPGVAGRAPVILFQGGAYQDSADWVRLASALAADRDVLAWDARGSGESGPGGRHSPEAHVGDALALLDHFNWNKAIVMGHSAGSAHAALFASRVPERAAALVPDVPGAAPQALAEHARSFLAGKGL